MSTNYSASGLVDSFHNLPHYDLSLNKVSNEFKYDDMTYLESLAGFAVPWIVLAILFGLLLGCTKCCCNKKKHSKYERIEDNYDEPWKKWRKWLLISVVVIVLMSPLEYYANEEITKGVKLFADRLSKAQSLYDEVIDQASLTKETVDELIIDVNNVTLPDTTKQEILDQLDQAADALNTVSDFSGAVDIGTSADEVVKYDKTRWEVMMGFACVLLLTAVISYCGKRSGSSASCYVDYIIAILAFIVTGAFFSFAVGFADFCADPNYTIEDLLPSDGTTRDAALYYINCPPNTQSPFLSDIDDALAYINTTATEMLRQCELTSAPDVCEVYNGMMEVNASATSLITETTCEGLHSEYVGALNAVCITTLEGFLMVIVGVAISAFAITLASFSLIKIRKSLAR